MKKVYLLTWLLLALFFVQAQEEGPDENAQKDSENLAYQESFPRINDLVHTKLDAKFDFSKAYMYGKVWITLKPHFYPTDSLNLDAKGMDIHQVSVVKGSSMKKLKYEYDGWNLRIMLDKTYKGGEAYTVYIDYTSKPNEVKVKGSAAINDAKGLYFINPTGEEKDKPTQVWTQGETEATSVWCPTIDKPNQKTTDEIAMTVPSKYVTLSNGRLASQKTNADGTRTDTWKMELPHAPYLFFMGIGDYAVIKDKYKDKEVNYYVEKAYTPVARKIFGLTPEMMSFFSRITGVDYPWVKYSQIVGRDYVSGAMENTTATLHQESAQQDARELVDGNNWEETIAHELFHQWFGDYVTTESWSNITLNESFANYSETLWREYKYGKDAGDAQNYADMQGYLFSNSGNKDLVRFYYKDKEDVFDAVSYNKGGRILNMLRNYVGDSAFFKALNLYLTTNKFRSAEAHQLRLAFEDVTGKDLNWYWNQWYFGAGNPDLDIQYSYDEGTKQVQVIVNQKQKGDKIFRLPVAIDVYNGDNKKRYPVWVENKTDTFHFSSATRPDLVNFDGDKVLLCTKKENKTLDEYIFQYNHAGLYVDRREAIEFASKKQDDPKAVAFLNSALHDKYRGLRNYALSVLNMKSALVKKTLEPTLVELAKKDPESTVRGNAMGKLGDYQNPEYTSLFKSAVNDSSYTVAGNALLGLSQIDNKAALAEAIRLSKAPAKGSLLGAISQTIIQYGDESNADIVFSNFESMPLSQAKFQALAQFSQFVIKLNDEAKVKRGVDDIAGFREAIPEAYRGQVNPFIDNILQNIIKAKSASPDLVTYIKSKLSDAEKKGF